MTSQQTPTFPPFKTMTNTAAIARCHRWVQEARTGLVHYVPAGAALPGNGAVPDPARDALRQAPLGAVIFLSDSGGLLVLPPFPIHEAISLQTAQVQPLEELILRPRRVAVIVVRLGRYGVAVYEGEHVLASKVGSRFVKNRNRKGGSSSGRFARRRVEQAHALYDKVCEVAIQVLEPHLSNTEHVILAGEALTLAGFQERCTLSKQLAAKRLARNLDVREPSHDTMQRLPRLIYQCRVAEFVLEHTNQ